MLAHLRRTIAEGGGWISFADYMNVVLYAPGLGYYAAGARKFGAAGDFVTAPELTPLFGAHAGRSARAGDPAASAMRKSSSSAPVRGRLCADVLIELAERDALPARYRLLEVSPELRERQREHLAATVPEHLPRVEWIDRLPERWRGAVLANEVLDALPAHVVARRGDEWLERGVAFDGAGALAFADRVLASRGLRERAQARFPAAGDYLSEFNPVAEALVMSLAQRCEQGLLLLVDYGFPAAEYYHPQRDRGHADGALSAPCARGPFLSPRALPISRRTSTSARWRTPARPAG